MASLFLHRDVALHVLMEELENPIDFDESYLEIAGIMPLLSIYSTEKNSPLLGTARINDYVEETVPRYSDPLFRAHFRMNRSSFQDLLELVGPHMEIKTVSLERRTLACLWYLSNQETFRSIVDRFGLSKGSLHYFLMKFCRICTSEHALQHLIQWPKSEQEFKAISEKFVKRAGFPNVIGAIDGTYIPISGPSMFRDSYICRKGFPAMHLQAVCDSDLQFLDVFSAYPGSVHDSRVFKNSPLYREMQQCPEKYHLVGDSAYGISTYLMVPFRDNGHLRQEEKKYNNALSSTRVDIERCFGLLKGKFRRLKFLEIRKLEEIPRIIVTCCALHNFILKRESFTDAEIEIDHDDSLVGDTVIGKSGTNVQNKSGQTKRLEIMHIVA